MGIKFVPFNRRENRRSLAIFFAEEIAHLGALKIARFSGVAVKIAAAPAENRAILVHSASVHLPHLWLKVRIAKCAHHIRACGSTQPINDIAITIIDRHVTSDKDDQEDEKDHMTNDIPSEHRGTEDVLQALKVVLQQAPHNVRYPGFSFLRWPSKVLVFSRFLRIDMRDFHR